MISMSYKDHTECVSLIRLLLPQRQIQNFVSGSPVGLAVQRFIERFQERSTLNTIAYQEYLIRSLVVRILHHDL